MCFDHIVHSLPSPGNAPRKSSQHLPSQLHIVLFSFLKTKTTTESISAALVHTSMGSSIRARQPTSGHATREKWVPLPWQPSAANSSSAQLAPSHTGNHNSCEFTGALPRAEDRLSQHSSPSPAFYILSWPYSCVARGRGWWWC